MAGSVGGQGPSVSGNLGYDLNGNSHPQNVSATIPSSKSTTRYLQKGNTSGAQIASSQAGSKGGQVLPTAHTPQSAQSMDQRQQINTTAAYSGAASASYGTRSAHQQARNAFSSKQKQIVQRSGKQESSIVDSSSQSSMSTHAKAWDIKGQGSQLDSQNSGKCDNCRYRVSKQERILYDCPECGSYIVSIATVIQLRIRF